MLDFSYLPRILGTLVVLAVCFSKNILSGQEKQAPAAAMLKPMDNRQCVLAGQDTHFDYLLLNSNTTKMHFEWSLTIDRRVVTRGKNKVFFVSGGDLTSVDNALVCTVSIPMPPMRASVVLPAELKLTWSEGKHTFKSSRSLHLYSVNSFAARNTFFQRAQIKLFDPNDKTAELFDDYEITHTRLISLAAIDMVTDGILLVGEGVSFHKQRKLANSLFRATRRGVPVLCLAPAEGEFPLKFEENGQMIQPTRLQLEQEDFVQQYDKRFDNLTSVSNLSLSPNGFAINAGDSSDYWSFMSLDFPVQKSEYSGRLAICCSNIISQWQSGPVPRYLLTHLLQELTALSLTEEIINVRSEQ